MVDVSRRRALVGALVTPSLVASCGTGPGDAKEIGTETGTVAPVSAVRIGEDRRIRGVNIGPSIQDYRQDSMWAGLWQRWDWVGRIKNELDDSKTLGGNCVRLIGNTHVVTSNVITKAAYLQQWKQFLDYTRQLGIWVYPCGGDLSHWGDKTSLLAAEDIYRGWAQLLGNYDHVIGIDISNEAPAQSRKTGGIAFQQPESWLYTVKRLGEIARDAAGKPISHSRSLTKYELANWIYGSPETDILSDFLDIHAYQVTADMQIAALHETEWGRGKQLIIGEFGANMTLDSATRTKNYQEIKSFVSDSKFCVGGLAWAIYDTGTDLESQYGLFDEERRQREDITAAFATFPTSR